VDAGDAAGDAQTCTVATFGDPSTCGFTTETVLWSFDDTGVCFAGTQAVEVATCGLFPSGCPGFKSLDADCVALPDGRFFVGLVRGDEYLVGVGGDTGARSTRYPEELTVPADLQATPQDLARCARALCAPLCDGGADPFAPWASACADAGTD
jgi:hypothetical protein